MDVNVKHQLSSQSLIINLISDFLSKLFTYATLLSRLLSASRGDFVMHFIYSQRQILIYRGDTASGPLHFASGKVTVREYTRSHFILGRRGKKRRRGEKERNRTAVLLGTPKL